MMKFVYDVFGKGVIIVVGYLLLSDVISIRMCLVVVEGILK